MTTKVYDLTKLKGKQILKNTKFALDTNILIWLYYSKADMTDPKWYQLKYYPKFIEQLPNSTELITTTCNITELLYRIEKCEYNILYRDEDVKFKDFRKLADVRQQIKEELQLMLLTIESQCQIYECPIDFSLLSKFVDTFLEHSCDNYDYAFLTALQSKGINNIISDDIDLLTFPNINLYTANRNTIAEAKRLHILKR